MREITKLLRSFLGLTALLCLAACAESTTDQPTPEAAKRFLKLRGYEFNEESFFKAASAGDVLAVNGFVSAGIDVNARNGDGDRALTDAAGRGDLNVVNALLRAGADINAKGRNERTTPIPISGINSEEQR